MPYREPQALPTRGDLIQAGAEPREMVYLLELVYAGRRWLWSSRPIEVLERDGTSRSYEGGLPDVQVSRALQTLASDPDYPSISLELGWDVAELVSLGHDLSASTGELSMILAGDLWEDRSVLIAGKVSQPEYGYPGDPVAFSLIEEAYDDRGVWPEPSAKVTLTAFPNRHESAEGLAYPQPFGQPGIYPGEDGTPAKHAPGSPVLPTGSIRAMLSDGWVISTDVVLWYDDTTGGLMEDSLGTLPVILTTDGNGRKVSLVDVSTHPGPLAALVAGQTMWACWYAGGTLEDPMRAGEAIRGAGDLCMWWLEQSSIAWDRGRWRALVPRLNAYRLSGYVDEEVTPWVWIRDNVLPLVPISIHSGKDGIYPVWWRYDAKRSECLETIRVMPGISLVGSVRYDRKPRDIVSEIRLKWAMDGATSDYRRTSVLEDQRDAADPESQSSAHARTSAHRASDARRVEVLESDLVWDEPTAALVLAARLAAVGWSPRTVTYSLPAEFAWLDLGDPVILIDPELYIDSVALIYGWALTDDGQVVLDLMLCGDPALATATTGPNPTGDDYDPDDPNQMPM